MPARKNRPVLYELVRRTRRTSDARWPRSAPTPKAETSGKATPPPGHTPSSGGGAPRPMRVARGRLHVELAWPGLAVVAVGAAFVLWVAFQAGMRYERAQPPAEAEPATASNDGELDPAVAASPDRGTRRAARPVAAQPVATPAPTQRPAEPPAKQESASPPATRFELQPGYHYVVIQHFNKRYQQTAIDAASFLRERGIDCSVIVRRSDVELVATTPFLLSQRDAQARARERERCNALKTQVRALGQEFSKAQAAAKKPQFALDQPYERLAAK